MNAVVHVMKLRTSFLFYYSAIMSKTFTNLGLSSGLVSQTFILQMYVDHLQQNILIGFVGINSITDVSNYSILHVKYYIYIYRVI